MQAKIQNRILIRLNHKMCKKRKCLKIYLLNGLNYWAIKSISLNFHLKYFFFFSHSCYELKIDLGFEKNRRKNHIQIKKSQIESNNHFVRIKYINQSIVLPRFLWNINCSIELKSVVKLLEWFTFTLDINFHIKTNIKNKRFWK